MPQVIGFLVKVGASFAKWYAAQGVIVQTALKVAASLAVSYVSQKLSSSRYDTLASLQGRLQNVRSTAQPRQTVYGRCRVGGQLAFVGNSGADNEYLWLVLVHAAHECEAVDKVYVNGEEVPLSGEDPTGGHRLTGFLKVWKHLGSDSQAADAELVAAFPGVWTTAHRLRGCCYTVWRLLWSNEENKWPNGIPVLTVELRGKRVWDFRDETTKYAANWALCVADYVKGARGATNADFSASEIAAAANLSDEAVALEDLSTEPRYELNAVIRADEDPEEVIDKMRAAAMGFIGEVGGFWTIHAGGWRPPAVTLTADDFHGPISVTTRQSIAEGGNGVRGVFADASENYAAVEFPAVENAAYLTEDGGIRRWIDLNLEYTTSSAAAQRLAKIALEEARQQIAVTARLSNRALRLRAGDVASVTLAKFGWTAKSFEVRALELVEERGEDGAGPGLFVEVGLRETASAVFDWAGGEETTKDPAPNTNLRSAWDVPPPVWTNMDSGTDQLIKRADGTVAPRVLGEWTYAGDAFVDRFELQWRCPGGHELSLLGWQPLAIVGAAARQVWMTENVVEGVLYDFRIRAISSLGVSSAWAISPTEEAVGKSEPPADPTGVSVAVGMERLDVSWTNPPDLDLAYVEVWRGSTNVFASAQLAGRTLAGAFPVTFHGAVANFLGTQYLWVRAVDTSGNVGNAVAAGSGHAVQNGYSSWSAGGLGGKSWVVSGSGDPVWSEADTTVTLTVDGQAVPYAANPAPLRWRMEVVDWDGATQNGALSFPNLGITDMVDDASAVVVKLTYRGPTGLDYEFVENWPLTIFRTP